MERLDRSEGGARAAANGLRALDPARSAPARMAPLAVLPVFADLRARPVLVAGGGEGAAWKAELLAAAGAHVTLLLGGDAEPFCAEARALGERIADPGAPERAANDRPGSRDRFGTLRLLERPWTPADLFGRAAPDATGVAPDRPALALIDTPCHAEAAAFAALARSAGVTVNAVDKPIHGDVQFGSIVNRSPAVVGISTDGAAPILGQAIRRRIETLLPPGLADWAGAMRGARARVLAMLPGRAERRAFFERFAELAFRPGATPGGPIGAGTTDTTGTTDPCDPLIAPGDPLIALADAVRREGRARERRGHVTLVGAGPGDAELLTLKAVRALQSADVILFDALVSEDVLELARREARRMLVGKRAGRESCRQEDINALMLKLAGEGRRVVRLKSGDPMVFGRAGEEIEALRAAGVPYEVVPGVTAAFALAASLGLSLTHRELARSVRFVTGHGSNGQLPGDLDWRGLADPATTLIVYMGARTASLLAERLVAEGLAPGTPALAATDVSGPRQRHWAGALGDLAQGLGTLDTDRPTIIAVGDAVGRLEASEVEPVAAAV